MSEHLLAMAIGPVQDFIAAARRTRDLWFGSHVLSEISKAAAKAVADEVGLEALIFPAPQAADELAPHGTESKLAVANVILARLPSGAVPADIAKAVKRAAEIRWREFANDARKEAKQRAVPILEDVWVDQVDDIVEFYSAWAALPSILEYQATRNFVMRLLAGRKACRNFEMSKGRAQLPKSSLDGARETVLDKDTKGSGRLPLSDGEQLDVIGLTKRLAEIQQSYPSVARIAADSWIQSIRKLAESDVAVATAFHQLNKACESLGRNVIHQFDEREFPQFVPFPFEGTAVYCQRHRDLAEETGVSLADLRPLAEAVKKLVIPRRADGSGGFGFGEPSPYLAILVADGDRMGAAISQIASPEAHQSFSRVLSSFAERARQVVRDANGVCVYAGGDDVLAFVPLDSCLSCARKLHSAFGTMMGGWKTSEGKSPTLSVGIAIGHFMEPLEDLLGFGRAAEQAAKKAVELGGKDERNALAVVVRTRGAAPISVRDNWKQCDDDAALDQRLNQWAELFADVSLPNKLPYELRQLVEVYKRWPTETDEQQKSLEKVLGKDVKRLLNRKQTDLKDAFVSRRIDSIKSISALKSLAEELLIAQQISAARPQNLVPSRTHQQEVVG